MKKKISILLFIFLATLISDCVTLPKSFYHDYDNPCTPGQYQNKVECEKWQQTYPREFNAYKKRMKIGETKKDSIN